MRIVNVKINDDKVVELTQEVVGYVEESNATQLMISLNTELQSSDITYHVISFRHGENDEKMLSQRIFQLEGGSSKTDAYRIDDKICITLPQYVTRYPLIFAQVEGHILKTDSETNETYIDTIIKSPVFLMKLDDSITGDSGEFNTKVEGIFAEFHDLENAINSVKPMIDLIQDGVEWDGVRGNSKPNIKKGDGQNSVMVGDLVNNHALGNYSATIGKNLVAYGDSSVIIGKYGRIIDGIIFAVANGTEENERLMFELAEIDGTFYVPIYGVTPELTAANHTMPTIEWVKDYLDAVVYPRYDESIAEVSADISLLKEELPEGLDEVSKEVLELRDTLVENINSNKPFVSGIHTLSRGGWSLNANGKYTQTVLSQVNTNRRNEIDVETESVEEWGKCFILAVSETSNSVVFEANDLPDKDLNFRITSTEVNYAV